MKGKMFIQAISLFVFSLLIGGFASVAFGANPLIVGTGVAGAIYLNAKANVQGAFFSSNPDVSALAAYAGTYERKLFAALKNGFEFIKHVTVMNNVKGPLSLTKLTTTANIRPFLSTEQMEGALAYSPRVLTLGRGKSEFDIDPVTYKYEWMNEVLNGNINALEIPFAAFTWDEVMKAVATELNDRTFYFGFDKADAVTFDAGDTYAAGDYIKYTISSVLHYYKCLASTSAGEDPEDTPAKWQKVNAEAVFEGLGSIIAADSAIEKITTGAITSGATALAAFRATYRGMDPAYKSMMTNMYCSYTDYEWLLDGVEDKLYQHSGGADASVGFTYLPGTDRRAKVIPVGWLTGSRRIVCTPKENILFGTNLLSDFNKINVLQSDLWTIKAGIAFEGGVQVRDVDAIKVNNQA